MNEVKRQKLRELAAQMTSTQDPNQSMLAQGTIELLNYTDELLETLAVATETCYEAVYIAYEGPQYNSILGL